MAIVPNKYVFIKESNGNVTMETYKNTDLIGTASLNPAKDIRISESYPESIIIPFNTTGNHINNKFVSIPWTKIDFVGSVPSNTAPADINEAVAILGEDFFFELGGGGGGSSARNGLDVVSGFIELGGDLIRDTIIDTDGFNFSLVHPYANFDLGDSFGINAIWFDKTISATEKTVIGILDTSGFGGDSDTVTLGRVSFIGAPTTLIQVSPTTGNIIANATNDISLNASNDIEISSLNKIGGSVGDPANVAGEYKVDYGLDPFATNPSVVFELKKNQDFTIGYAAVDDGTRKYSTIYYGHLDSSNNITDINRVEANESFVELVTDSDNFTVKLFTTGELEFDVLKVLMPTVAPLNFADDTAAAAGGVDLNQVYHNNGELRIRIA